MNFSIEIDNIRNYFKKQKFINERNYLKEKEKTIEDDEEDNWILDRLQNLEIIINKFKEPEPENDYGKKIDEFSKYIYKKKWHLLPEFHKIVKIEEYISKSIENKDHREKILNELKELINNKKLNGKKYIIYDQSIPEITSIPALKYNQETGEYKIKS